MKNKNNRRAALVYHAKPNPGKIEVNPTTKYSSQRDLARVICFYLIPTFQIFTMHKTKLVLFLNKQLLDYFQLLLNPQVFH